MTQTEHARRITLPSGLNSLTTLGVALRDYLAPLGVGESWIYPLDLALCEAATNIILHGYADRPEASFEAVFSRDGDAVSVTLVDSGIPIPVDKIPPPDLDDALTLDQVMTGGRGLYLIYRCVDEVRYWQSEQGNHLMLTRRLPG